MGHLRKSQHCSKLVIDRKKAAKMEAAFFAAHVYCLILLYCLHLAFSFSGTVRKSVLKTM